MVLLCDGQEGPTAADEEVIGWMRRVHSSKPVILAVNKCESATQGELQAASFWNYGLEPLAVSAISGVGTGLMMERLVEVRTRARFSFVLLLATPCARPLIEYEAYCGDFTLADCGVVALQVFRRAQCVVACGC